jgi:hypothetical protein
MSKIAFKIWTGFILSFFLFFLVVPFVSAGFGLGGKVTSTISTTSGGTYYYNVSNFYGLNGTNGTNGVNGTAFWNMTNGFLHQDNLSAHVGIGVNNPGSSDLYIRADNDDNTYVSISSGAANGNATFLFKELDVIRSLLYYNTRLATLNIFSTNLDKNIFTIFMNTGLVKITTNLSVDEQIWASNLCYSNGSNCNTTIHSTFNATYDQWAYNQTYSGSTFNATYDAGTNATFNQSLTDLLYAEKKWGYNMSDGSYNSTYATWAYNQTYSGSTFNSTYDGLINNASYLSTYNATYAAGINATFNQTLTDLIYIPYTGSSKEIVLNAYNFTIGASLKMVMDAGLQKLGIGTTSPRARLHVYIDDILGIPALLENTDLLLSDTSTVSDAATLSLVGGNNGSSNLKFGDQNDVSAGEILYDHQGETMNFSINHTDNQMVLDYDGNLILVGNVTGDWLFGKLNFSNVQNNPWAYNQTSSSVYNVTYDNHVNNATIHNSTFLYNQTADANTYSVATFLKLIGGTLTGALNMSGNNITNVDNIRYQNSTGANVWRTYYNGTALITEYTG